MISSYVLRRSEDGGSWFSRHQGKNHHYIQWLCAKVFEEFFELDGVKAIRLHLTNRLIEDESYMVQILPSQVIVIEDRYITIPPGIAALLIAEYYTYQYVHVEIVE